MTESLFEDDNTRQRVVQRGEVPALTIRQLVDAQRQRLAGAGADISTIRLLLSRNDYGPNLTDAVERLAAHITHINKVSTMAFEEASK
jgi:hypothetical protein